MTNHLSEDGAHRFARRIQKYWEAHGLIIDVWTEQAPNTKSGLVWQVRSNLLEFVRPPRPYLLAA
jgi:hypothetical protein